MKKLIFGVLGIVIVFASAVALHPNLISSVKLDDIKQLNPISGLSLGADFGTKPYTEKCTTASGEVIYGSISDREKCLNIETVDTNITIVQSETTGDESASSGAPLLRNMSDYNCDGRTHCSQMRSCEEARFFLANCTNMKVDGDGDGIPCERQWCR